MPKIKTDKKFRSHNQSKKTSNAAGGGGVQQGLRFNKDFGQHILKNPLIITNMIDKVILNIKLFNENQNYLRYYLISRQLYNQQIQFLR